MNTRVFARIALIILVGVGMLLAAGCGLGADSDPLSTTRTPTLMPAYQSTQQASVLAAQSTQVYGQAEQSNLATTGTAIAIELNVRSTMVAAEMTAAAATEAAYVQATQAAEQATATAQAAQLTATQAAMNNQATEAAAQATSTQAAIDSAVRGTATQAYLGILQANAQATQVAVSKSAQAEVDRVDNQRRSEEMTLWFNTWVWRVAGFLGTAAVIILIGYLLVWSWPWIMSRLSVHREGDKIVMIFPQKDGWAAFTPTLNGKPGAMIPNQAEGRELITAGGFEDDALQNQVTARAQASDLVRALNGGHPGAGQPNRQGMYRRAMQAGQRPQELPAGQQQPNGFRILTSAGELPEHLRPDVYTLRAIDAEWRDATE